MNDLNAQLEALKRRFGLAEEADSALPESAALSGAFEPQAMTADPGTLAALIAASDPVPGATQRLRWLRAEPRRAILSRLLTAPGALVHALSHARPAQDDAPGQALCDLLAAARPKIAGLSDARLGALLTALGWLEGLAPPEGHPPFPSPREIQSEIARRGRERAARALLLDGFVGRHKALQDIRGLLSDPESVGKVLLLTGPGGIGKSTLLAEAVRQLSATTPVFHFDFDRPALDPRGAGLTLDFTRQLGQLLPERAEELSQMRGLIGSTFRHGGGEAQANPNQRETTFRATSEAGYRIGQIATEAGLGARPVLMVFDTLEIVAAQGEDGLAALNEWLNFARYVLGLSQLRVVIAGRAAEASASRFDATRPAEVLPLEPDEAQELLRGMGLDARRAEEAAGILGGNPLVLRLGGRYLLDHPQAPASDLKEGGAGDTALTQGVLYRRILNHVGRGPDDPLRQLAYPGLVLRLVTPAVVRAVIAPALGLTLAPDEERNLWQRLVDQTWLVETQGPNLARHRPDLRAEMLRLMRRDAGLAPLVLRLNRLAEAHFRKLDDPDLPAERAAQEAVYHALMTLPPGDDLPESVGRLVPAAIGADADELPPAAAALARALTGVLPRAGDIALLPDARRDLALARLGWAAVDAERPQEALSLAPEDDAPWAWRLTAWSMAGLWRDPTVARALERLSPVGEHGAAAWWPAQLSRLAHPGFAALAPRETQEAVEAAAAWLRLMRDAPEPVPGWSGTWTPQRPLSPTQRVDRLREATARALTSVNRGMAERDAWDGIAPQVLPDQTEDPRLTEERARYLLLQWACGRLGPLTPDTRIPLSAAMIAPTPALLRRYSGLIAATARPGFDAALARIGPEATSAQLTGAIAQEIATALAASRADRIGPLSRAGLTPALLVRGLHPEFRATARTLLAEALRDEVAQAALAGRLGALLHLADGPFVPADLQPEAWAKAVGQANGSRAISALVDWAARIGRLAALAEALPDTAATPRLLALAEAIRRIDRAFGSSL